MSRMGRKRTTGESGLPPRMHKKGLSYYYVTTKGGRRWIPLGRDYKKALAEWSRLEGASLSDNGETATVIKRYKMEIVPTKAKKTQVEYERACKRLSKSFGGMPLAAIKTPLIYQYLDKHPHKTTANREIAVLSAIFTKAMRWGLVESNPCQGVERNKEKARDRYITDDEFAELRTVASPFIKAVMDIAYLTGMRKGDILKIRISDITDDGLFVKQGKTGKKQSFEWTPTMRLAVSAAKALPRRISSMFLFCTRNGTPYTISGFDSIWQRAVKKSNIDDFHFHDIRAKALTDADEQKGKDYAQAVAGHASVVMTERYIKGKKVEKVRPLR